MVAVSLKSQKNDKIGSNEKVSSPNHRLDAFMIVSTPQGVRCRICGRTLTDPESIQRGIGPECARKLGLLKDLYRKGTTAKEAAMKLEIQLQLLPVFLAELGGLPCQYCNLTLSNKHELVTHCAEQHDRPHPCLDKTCNYAFKFPSNARSHFNRKHSDEKPHKCPHDGCDYSTSNAGDLNSHVRHVHSEDRPFECPTNCGYRAKDRSKIIRHLQRKSCWYQSSIPSIWEVFCYRVANLLFGEKMKWKPKIHVSGISENQEFIQPEIVIFDENGEIEKIIDAKTSLYALTYKDVNIYPLLSEQTEFWVLHCHELDVFSGRSEEKGKIIIRSIEDLLNELNCFSQQLEATRNRQEIEHLIRDLKEFMTGLETGDLLFNCPKCWRKDFENLDELKKHVDQCDGVLKCPDCGKSDFSDLYHYEDHVKACGGKLTCSKCGRNDFNFKNTYDAHVKACGGNLRCSKCGKTGFNSKSYYNSHVEACSGNLECPDCGRRGFTSKRYYDDHVAACGGKLKCPDCGRRDFTSKRYYTGHVKACGGKLKCKHCGRNDFSSDINYNKHVKKCSQTSPKDKNEKNAASRL